MNKGKKYLITDTHWNHKIFETNDYRPKNYKELSIENCRKILKPDDSLIHLGDVIFSRQSELTEILNSFSCLKILVRGNHEHEKDDWYINHGFDYVVNELLFNMPDKENNDYYVWLSHKPIPIEYDKSISIHGHFHNSNRFSIEETLEKFPFYSDNHILLSIEEMNYKPIQLEEFLKLKLPKIF